MSNKLEVKELLRNKGLYEPLGDSTLRGEWKYRLFKQFVLQQQLKNALMERPSFFINPVSIVTIFILFLAFAIATYFGFLNPEHWFDNIGWITKINIPPIGLKEILIFAGTVNLLTYMIRKRSHYL